MSQQKQFALVTGASSGIGLALAKQFIHHGFDLVICSSSDDIVEAAASLRLLGAEVTSIRADLSRFTEVERLALEIDLLGRPLDAAALNAGVGLGGDFARETLLSEELEMIALNVTSTVHLAKRVIPAMIDRGKGRVLFTASIAATMPGTYSAVYNATKAFVLSFAEAIREELKETGVSVTALMPGATATNFFRRAKMEDTKVGVSEKDSADLVAKIGFDALMAGDDSVVAGSAKVKMQGTMNELLSETVKAKAHGEMAKPGSASEVSSDGETVVEYLRGQHAQLKEKMQAVIDAEAGARKRAFNDFTDLMKRHEAAEQAIVHPVSKRAVGAEIVTKHLREEAEAEALIGQLERLSPDDAGFIQLFKKLQTAVLAHAQSEELNEFFPLADKLDQARLQTMEKEAERVEATTPKATPAQRLH